jgi:hypothetical protein
LVLLALTGCAQLPPTASVAMPPIPAREARLWIYRDDGPYESQERPFVRLNGQVVGISEPNGAFYRDLAPGRYTVTADSYHTSFFDQFASIDLAVGEEAYVKVLSLRVKVGGELGSRPVFYTYRIPPEKARPAISRSPFYGSGQPPIHIADALS